VATQDPQIILKNYKLIYRFLTAPICKDTGTVGKIIAMLTEQMQVTNQLFSKCDLMHYEKIISEVHFKKLTLLSKLIIQCFDPSFKRIEVNVKRMKP
jgi:hypothetical protein